MKIFDCFTFFNELELLDLRLMVLNDLVDFFVLVEANKTHTGNKKEFVFEQNKDKFSDYINKIIYVKVEDLPEYSINNIWIAENFQRNCIERGISSANVGDKIIVSDVDELPNPDTIIQNLDTSSIGMAQKLFYYYVNCIQNQVWNGSGMVTYKKYNSLHQIRKQSRDSIVNIVPNGGWHYSYMGGAEKVRLKAENIAESSIIIDRVGSVSEIQKKIKAQQDLWGRVDNISQKQIVDISVEGMAPKCINKFIEKYPNFYYKQEKK